MMHIENLSTIFLAGMDLHWGRGGSLPPAPPPPNKKKKFSIKKLRFALIYIYIYIFVSPPLKYLDIDLQENK